MFSLFSLFVWLSFAVFQCQGEIFFDEEKGSWQFTENDKPTNGGDLASQLGEQQIKNINSAMQAIQAESCIKFISRTTQHDYIYFENTPTGCNSAIGRSGGAQRISLQRGYGFNDFCLQVSSVAHELLHSVGLWHEHTRTDRDNYITVNLANVEPQHRHNFNKVNPQTTSTYGAPYDYSSIMHYAGTAGAINRQMNVMTTKDASKQNVIGNAQKPSYYDFFKINKIYNCQRKNGQFVSVAKCSDAARDCPKYAGSCSNSRIKAICPVTCMAC